MPATIGVLDGELVVGLTETSSARFDAAARKLGPRDLAAAVVQGAVGATTVGGTLAVVPRGRHPVHGDRRARRRAPRLADAARRLGRPAARSPQTQVLVVSSGVKSLLDVPATAELLETLGVPVLGWRTDTLPLFYAARRRPAGLGARRVGRRGGARRARRTGSSAAAGCSLGRPPDESLDDVEPLIERALAEAAAAGVHGQAVTPFVLSYLHRESGGRTLRANRDLIVGNARLAGEIAATVVNASAV